LIKSKTSWKNFGKIFQGLQKESRVFFNWAKHHQFSFFLKGRGEKSCFLRTLSQFMFTYWFKKWVEVSHQFLFHTHALWQKFVHLFATQGGKMQVHHNFFCRFQKKFFLKREEEGKIIDASVLLSLDAKACNFQGGKEFVFFNYWKHKTKCREKKSFDYYCSTRGG